MEDLVHTIAIQLVELGKNLPRVIIFCKQYDQCSAMYSMFKYYLGPHFTISPSAPDLSIYRVVDMYTRCTEASVKQTGTYSFKGQFIQRSIHKSSQRFASLCVVKKPAAGPTTCSHY